MTMATIKSYTDLKQSKVLSKILPLESADMYLWSSGKRYYIEAMDDGDFNEEEGHVRAWSLAALLGVLPEINGIPLTLEKVKAEDGYEGYYYHIEYKDKILIPYSKNPVDACCELILRLHELKML